MTLIILLCLLAGMFLLNEEYYLRSQGMMRHYALIGGACAIGILAVPNGWLQALLLVMLFNLLRDPLQGSHHARALPLYLLMLAGVVALEHLTIDSVRWILLGMTGVGIYIAIICLLEWWPHRDSPRAIHGWQENQNNVQAVSAICVCAAIGYSLLYPPAWFLVPITLIPIILTQSIAMKQQGFTVTMAPLVLAGVGLFCLPFWLGWWSLIVFFFVGFFILWGIGQALRHDRWWDSGRIRLWFHMLLTGWLLWGLSGKDAIKAVEEGRNERGQPYTSHERKQVLWSMRPCVILFGRGWQSWMPFQDHLLQIATASRKERLRHVKGTLSDTDILQTDVFLSTAHNEYAQMLFEHGLLGFIALCGYVGTGLWALAHGSLEAQAVYVVALGVCGVATMLHPFSVYHNTYTDGTNAIYSIGSPGLVWMSLLTALMVELAR